ncbi:Bark storage protein A [Vitis vinifera]|uniref:Bark storage protein A n=1 Tax=Vitis vinifera TaxID=29760 RepID=A0A438DS24_VITVI|nr:Bark storage protein A [Vitis vinifera]
MGNHLRSVLMGFLVMVVVMGVGTEGAVSVSSMKKITRVNKEGPYLGIVVPNSYEMDPLLQSPSFVADDKFPYLDFAGNANPNLQIGDVTVPKYWAHTGLWNWQRYGDGPGDELAFESSGDYTRKIGYLKFSDYNNHTKNGNSSDNLLNNVWYQPEEVFPVTGTPEVRQHAFWVPVDKHFYQVAGKLKDLKLEGCVNSTCLPRAPMVTRVERGVSANVFVDNGAYREFLYSKFNATPVDMESAAVALVCLQQKTPFIAIRALSDLAGGGSALSNEASVFSSLAAQNSVDALVRFIALLYS